VREYLISREIAADRITAEGFGESRPVADNDTAEGRANNRRVEIVVKPGK
jgi:outer membrane protein OmpA-like peptidoglycan-associated protein